VDLSEGETSSDNEKQNDSVDEAKIVPLKKRKTRRYIRIFLSAAAAVLITVLIYPLFSGPGSGRFYASFGTSSGFKIAMNDFHRGKLAGMADISFGHNEKGEPLYIFPGTPKSPKDKTYTLETGNGHEIILKLPGGTLVWVNAESSINFSANFTQDTIYMKVDGEAYFEIPANSTKYFVISALPSASAKASADKTANELHLRPSLAKFNFTAYPNDSVIRANMISGKAIVQSGSVSSVREIQAGQQALFNKGNISVVPAADTSEILALKNGEIYLREASIQTIMATISKWYNVEIHYAGGEIPDSKLTLRVPLESKLSVIVDSLKKQGLRIYLLGNAITILK
jgi:transmembrane sensor